MLIEKQANNHKEDNYKEAGYAYWNTQQDYAFDIISCFQELFVVAAVVDEPDGAEDGVD